MEKIKTFRIMQYANEIERVKANTEREALCIYLMNVSRILQNLKMLI